MVILYYKCLVCTYKNQCLSVYPLNISKLLIQLQWNMPEKVSKEGESWFPHFRSVLSYFKWKWTFKSIIVLHQNCLKGNDTFYIFYTDFFLTYWDGLSCLWRCFMQWIGRRWKGGVWRGWRKGASRGLGARGGGARWSQHLHCILLTHIIVMQATQLVRIIIKI